MDFSDDFDRTDLGPDWVTGSAGEIGILEGALSPNQNTAHTDFPYVRLAEPFGPDGDYEIDFYLESGAKYVYLVFNANATFSDAYFLEFTYQTNLLVRLYDRLNGFTQIDAQRDLGAISDGRVYVEISETGTVAVYHGENSYVWTLPAPRKTGTEVGFSWYNSAPGAHRVAAFSVSWYEEARLLIGDRRARALYLGGQKAERVYRGSTLILGKTPIG